MKTVMELGILVVTLTATIVGMQWRLSAVEKGNESRALSHDMRAADLERSVNAIGAKLDDARSRLTAAERDISHQNGALARIESAINVATARLEVKIGDVQRQIVDALANRKDG
jgi:predicted  nucleic acid-binding Zn-ribbon protein